VFLANIVGSAVNIFRPYWTLQRAVFRLLSDGAGCALCWAMKFNIIVTITVANVAPEKTARVAQVINSSAVKLFPLALARLRTRRSERRLPDHPCAVNAGHPVALNTASRAC
jgi:hypothetical protein